MKHKTYIAILLFVIFAGLCAMKKLTKEKPAPYRGPGIEIIREDEVTDEDNDQFWIIRFHDKISGQEILCVQKSGCVLTGRVWR